MMKSSLVLLAALFFMATVSATEAGQSGSGTNGAPAYLNPQLPTGQRVDDLLSRMTPEEKT
ncbi:MAG TPA: hypothetical protein VMF08_04100 [Candidatus Sulfotelmatobacter sp.]|nr:hypothetical protein [Candidatus Sulfotelmatobacter sp.]